LKNHLPLNPLDNNTFLFLLLFWCACKVGILNPFLINEIVKGESTKASVSYSFL